MAGLFRKRIDPEALPEEEAFWARRQLAGEAQRKLAWASESGETRVIHVGGAQAWRFCSNFVRSSKYTMATFVPLFLYQAFNPTLHAANTFFLVICAMQCVPYITYTAVVTLNGVEVGTPTTLLPLSLVVFVDAVFQAMEDISRHRADKEANNSETRVVDWATGKVRRVAWRNVRVGDVVVCKNREVVPADLVVLTVSANPDEDATSGDGVCYVETKSLDGETNLKQRRAIKAARARVVALDPQPTRFDLSGLRGTIDMEQPNDLIQKFEGTIRFDRVGDHAAVREPVALDSVYLRGCTVRSIDWIAGIAVNTGPDTKIMKSNKEPPIKESSLVGKINRLLKYIIILLLIVCTLGAMISAIWLNSSDGRNAWYLGYERVDSRWGSKSKRNKQAHVVNVEEAWYIKFFYYFLLLAQFVPVSLYVSMSMTKNFQALFLEWDVEMYHEDSDTPAKVKTMALNEELGQISHVFSDKTGTLTCNVMDFRKCSIAGVSYGKGITAIGAAALKRRGEPVPEEALDANLKAREFASPHVTFYDPTLRADLERADQRRASIIEFFRLLAVCHTVLVERADDLSETRASSYSSSSMRRRRHSSSATTETTTTRYSASSPDDEALVCGAKYFGLTFEERSSGTMTIRNDHADDGPANEVYEIIEMLDFNSDRKRMSVVCRRADDPDADIVIYCKGADTVMENRLAPGQDDLKRQTFDHMVSFSAEGLRTLVCARATLDRQLFERWLYDYRSASADLDEIRKRQNHQPNRVDDLMDDAERAFGAGLTLLGSTAIEDRLQDGVPETVHKLLDAGVKVWVLTGDKQETAINIGVACQLIEPPDVMEQIVVNAQLFASVSDKAAAKARAEALSSGAADDDLALLRVEDRARTRAASLALASLFEREALRLARQVHDYRDGDAPPPKPRALVIDGESLLVALDDEPLPGEEEYSSRKEEDEDEDEDDESIRSSTAALEAGGSELERRPKQQHQQQQQQHEEEPDDGNDLRATAESSSSAPSNNKVRCRFALLQLAKHCKAVVGCRVSPIQKRLMVELVRFGGAATAARAAEDHSLRRTRTLAIGDGANDVPMIQGAHVGVGISGQEGMQAVNNSDYAIAQFRFLQRLMLVHGRWNYRRTSKLVCHVFYKNVLQAMLTFWYATQTQMSGTKFMVEYAASTVYAVFYTSIPVILVGVLDQDVSAETALAHPELYRPGPVDTYFNRKIFAAWIAEAMVESFVAVYVPLLALNPSLVTGNADGNEVSLWDLGAASFTIIVIIANTKLVLNQYRFTWLDGLFYFLSIGSWFVIGTIYGVITPGGLSGGYPEWEWYWTFPRLLGDQQFWLAVILSVLVVFVRDFAWKGFVHLARPQLYHVYAERQCLFKDEEAMPRSTTSTPIRSSDASIVGGAVDGTLDPSLRDVQHPSKLVLTAIDLAFEPKDSGDGDDKASEGAAARLDSRRLRQTSYDESRPSLEHGERLEHEYGFAYSTDSRTHAAEIMHAKSTKAFLQCGPVVDADAYRRSEMRTHHGASERASGSSQ